MQRDNLAKRKESQMNQCDGCRAKMPVKDGLHINIHDRAYMACSASKYQVEEIEMNVNSEVSAIDFHVGDHLIQACGNNLTFFILGDTSKEGVTFLNDDLRRILKVAEEQAESY